MQPSILTFGGDRETFDFTDPLNYLNVDNDVWRFAPPSNFIDAAGVAGPSSANNSAVTNSRGRASKVATVPEPHSALLMLVGAASACWRRRYTV